MSFFNSLQQYVTSSVANLSLSPKRFTRGGSGSSTEGEQAPAAAPPPSPRSSSAGNVQHGFPKVVPPPGTVSSRRRTLECASALQVGAAGAAAAVPGALGLPPGHAPRRQGSFRRQQQQLQHPRPPLMFCRRRQSWPEVDQQATSGSAAEEPPTSQPTVLPVTYAAALASPTALQRRPVTTNDATNEPDQTPTETASDGPPPLPATDAAPKMPAQPDADSDLGNTREIDSLIVPTATFLPEQRDSLPSSDTEGRTRKQRSPKRRK
ncbi:wiskott-Aldrich syndrome protein family member 2-like [Schistocerca piceifrons]|uniref:wiskott-Aldrich syndrome protein family member 2-like n=1 Tax=Schistocerca piceifrons TaxID=274613 RepID=UPI001F5F7BE5|nr:wiskott-Aldrich syndrome protein family member 2-like [Schistocerca piceifrons]